MVRNPLEKGAGIVPCAYASLILGIVAAIALILWLFFGLDAAGLPLFLAAVFAILFGHVSLRGARHARLAGKWMAIAGLASGYVVLGLAYTVGVRTHQPSKEGARRAACKNSLKYIGKALQLYAANYDGWFPVAPPGGDSTYALGLLFYDDAAYLQDAESVLICPGDKDVLGRWRRAGQGWASAEGGLRPSSTSYTYIPGLHEDLPTAEMMVMFDKRPNHHGHGRNVLFADGHVRWWSKEHTFQARLSMQEAVLPWMREHMAATGQGEAQRHSLGSEPP